MRFSTWPFFLFWSISVFQIELYCLSRYFLFFFEIFSLTCKLLIFLLITILIYVNFPTLVFFLFLIYLYGWRTQFVWFYCWDEDLFMTWSVLVHLHLKIVWKRFQYCWTKAAWVVIFFLISISLMIFCLILSILRHIKMCISSFKKLYVCVGATEGCQIPWIWICSSCEPPDVSARNWILIFCKSSKHS